MSTYGNSEYGPKSQAKIEKVMHDYKEDELKTSLGQTVSNPKQAIAIGLSEAQKLATKVVKKKGK